MLNFLLAFDDLNFGNNWEVVKHALNFLWQGLLAIFVVIGLIIVVVKLTALAIDKANAIKKQREEENSENNQSDV